MSFEAPLLRAGVYEPGRRYFLLYFVPIQKSLDTPAIQPRVLHINLELLPDC